MHSDLSDNLQRVMNNSENTMNTIIQETIIRSIEKIRARYNLRLIDSEMPCDSDRETILFNEFKQYIESKVNADYKDAPFYNDYKVALRALHGKHRDRNGDEIETACVELYSSTASFNNNNKLSFIPSGIGLRNLIALFWEATKHAEDLQEGVSISDAQEALVKVIAYSIRGHNRDNQNGVDDQANEDRRVCGRGHFNQFGEQFKSIHKDTSDIILDLNVGITQKLRRILAHRLKAIHPDSVEDAQEVANLWNGLRAEPREAF